MRTGGKRRQEGQTMLLVVLALGGTILGATTIGGLLLNYQIRQSTEMANSTKAIFAADAGFEWALKAVTTENTSTVPLKLDEELPNGARVVAGCRDANNQFIECWQDGAARILSVGTFNNTSRAFELKLK